MRFADFEALSFDCYGTLIDWEAGITAVLGPWATRCGLDLDQERLLEAYAGAEAKAELEHPGERYPDILARSFRSLGDELGARSRTRTLRRWQARFPTGQRSRTPKTL